MDKKTRRRLLMGKHLRLFNGSGFDGCTVTEKEFMTFEGGKIKLTAQAATTINHETHGIIPAYPAAYIQLKAPAAGFARCVVKYRIRNVKSLSGAHKQKKYAVIVSDTQTDIKHMTIDIGTPSHPNYISVVFAEEKGNAKKEEFAAASPPSGMGGTLVADIKGFDHVYIAAITAEDDVSGGEAGYVEITELWLEG